MGFDDLSMSAVTALGHLRRYALTSGQSVEDAFAVVPKTTADRSPHDYVSAMHLHLLVDEENTLDDLVGGLHSLILDLLKSERPAWLSVVQSGRDYVRRYLSENVDQVFETAGLFDSPPSLEVVDWWDGLASVGWSQLDQQNLTRGREAEWKSLEYERERLRALGCPNEPRWVSVDDNQAGYDIATWESLNQEWELLPLEVKSTVKPAPEFHLSRYEFDTCKSMQRGYRFHVWTNNDVLYIFEREAIISLAPTDSDQSQWQDAVFKFPRKA